MRKRIATPKPSTAHARKDCLDRRESLHRLVLEIPPHTGFCVHHNRLHRSPPCVEHHPFEVSATRGAVSPPSYAYATSKKLALESVCRSIGRFWNCVLNSAV